MVSYMLDLKKTGELKKVLILVVVEDGLVPDSESTNELGIISLNPCCSGRWSRT